MFSSYRNQYRSLFDWKLQTKQDKNNETKAIYGNFSFVLNHFTARLQENPVEIIIKAWLIIGISKNLMDFTVDKFFQSYYDDV